jgi:hypothetical protein
MSRSAVAVALATTVFCSCQSIYYDAMEKVGVHKRDILVDRVQSARDSQADAKEQFKDALEQFSAVVHFEGGKLEEKYNKLSREFERCSSGAEEVKERVAKVESVANALFKEWKSELRKYTSRELRDASERQLRTTRDKYDTMIASMHKAAKTMDPILGAFQDQVLFLKHNLNARAIASIQQEAARVEADVARLIKDMEASIAEADAFIREMGTE